MKNIQITISGDRCAGKTTMSKLLSNFLTMLGCQVEIKEINRDLQNHVDKLQVSPMTLQPWKVTINSKDI